MLNLKLGMAENNRNAPLTWYISFSLCFAFKNSSIDNNDTQCETRFELTAMSLMNAELIELQQTK